MTLRHRVAILGAGIGAAHLKGYLAVPEYFEVRLICDAATERARLLAEEAGGIPVVETIEEAIRRDDIDVVDVCLPPHMHGDVAKQALTAGKHVICEKPICGSLEEFDQIAACAASNKRHLFPVFQYRYGLGIQKLRHLKDADVLGKPLVASLETHWNRLPAYYDNPWRGRVAYELGGAVLSHAIHMHDLLGWMLGPIRRVHARVATRVNDIETEDCAAISFEMESGALVTHSITLGGAEEISRIRLCFGEVTVENEGLSPYDPGAEPWRFLPRRSETEAQIDEALDRFAAGASGFPGLFNDVQGALATDEAAWALQETGRCSIELASAVYYSSATGEDVALPISDQHPVYGGWAGLPAS